MPTDTFILESDSQNRRDLQLIREKQFEEAEKVKVDLEEKQRNDKKLRIAADKRQNK